MNPNTLDAASAALSLDGEDGAGLNPQRVIPRPLFNDLVQFFRLLADETRMQILLLLMRETELHVGALCKLLGHSQPSISHHLALLREGGLIEVRRDGKHNYYRLIPGRIQGLLGAFTSEVPGAPEQHDILNRIHPPLRNDSYDL